MLTETEAASYNSAIFYWIICIFRQWIVACYILYTQSYLYIRHVIEWKDFFRLHGLVHLVLDWQAPALPSIYRSKDTNKGPNRGETSCMMVQELWLEIKEGETIIRRQLKQIWVNYSPIVRNEVTYSGAVVPHQVSVSTSMSAVRVPHLFLSICSGSVKVTVLTVN